MNKTSKLVGAGIAVIVGSVLSVAPVAAAAVREHPARICVDNASSGQCETIVRQSSLPGGSGQEVVVRSAPSGRIDAKDHSNYGQVTPENSGRIDAKDHSNYGQVTPEYTGRVDAKDHPNYGPTSAPGGGGGVIFHQLRGLRAV
jgi:hypothetical protein